jgi:hypothetical protein
VNEQSNIFDFMSLLPSLLEVFLGANWLNYRAAAFAG